MDDMENKVEFDKSSDDENSSSLQQNRNILEEINNLERIMRDPANQTFKKSTYWNQLNNNQDNLSQDSILKEIIDCLLRIESKITQIETMLNK